MSNSEMTQLGSGVRRSSSASKIEAPQTAASSKYSHNTDFDDFEDAAFLSEDERSRLPPKEKEQKSSSRALVVKAIRAAPKESLETASFFRSKRDPTDLREDNDELRRANRLLDRESREQSIKLHNLKKENELLLEQCRQRGERVDSHRDQIQHDRHKFYEHVETLKEEITYLNQELQRRKALAENLTMQTREANEEKVGLEHSMRKLQKQIRELSENLTECKDDLLRLQPPSGIPDSEVAEQYSNLAQQISRWVDDVTEDSQATEAQFESLAKHMDVPELLKPYLTDEHIRLGRKSPNSQPYILRYVIHRYLESCMLGHDIYLFGLDMRSIALLEGMEQGMKELEPPRDSLTIRRWRSEALQALTKMPEFFDEQRQQAAAVSQSLYAAISRLLPEAQTNDTGWRVLHEDITLPTLRLATTLRISPSSYRLSYPSPSSKAAPIYMSAIPRATLTDLATNKLIRPDSLLKPNSEGRIGEEVLIISPTLVRIEEAKEGERAKNIMLVKPNVVVRLDEAMGRRNKGGMRGLGEWAGSFFGATPAPPPPVSALSIPERVEQKEE